MGTFKIKNANGTWDFLQITGEDVTNLTSQLAENATDLKYRGLNAKNYPIYSDGIHDDAPGVNQMLSDADSLGIGKVILPTQIYLGAPVTVPSNMTLEGNNIVRTKVYPLPGFTGRLFQALGQYRSEGTTTVSNIVFKNMAILGNNVADQGVYIKGGYKILFENVQLKGFIGEHVYYDQVYDSYFEKCIFEFNAGTDKTRPMLMLNYGGGDNTNEIHFDMCRFENFTRPAIKMQSGGTSANLINEIKFNSCKWESIYKTDFIIANTVINVNFVLCNFALPNGTLATDTPFYGIRATNSNSLHFMACEAEWFTSGDVSFALIHADATSKNISWQGNLNAFVYNGTNPIEVDSGFQGLTLIGAYENGVPANTVTNALDSVVNMVPQLNIIGKQPWLNLTYSVGSTYYKNTLLTKSDGSVELRLGGVTIASWKTGGLTWTDATLLNGFNHLDSTHHVQYSKDLQTNFVCLQGVATGGSAGTTVFNLPAGSRPISSKYFSCPADASGAYVANFRVDANGNVVFLNSNNPTPTAFLAIDYRFKGEQ